MASLAIATGPGFADLLGYATMNLPQNAPARMAAPRPSAVLDISGEQFVFRARECRIKLASVESEAAYRIAAMYHISLGLLRRWRFIKTPHDLEQVEAVERPIQDAGQLCRQLAVEVIVFASGEANEEWEHYQTRFK